MQIYIGTYTDDSDSEGIYRCEFDVITGAITKAELAGEAANPSFLALDPDGPYLYAVCEEDVASVVSFRITDTGDLERIDAVPTGGSGGCHVAVSSLHRTLYAANYGDGSVMSCSIGLDGTFSGKPSTIRHSGTGPNLERQEGPHAHSVNIDPDGDSLLVADLGTDNIVVYDISGGGLSEMAAVRGTALPGSGPRHMVFSPTGGIVYCLNELTSTVSSYDYIPGESLALVDTVPGLPTDFAGESTAADVHLHPSGEFLYSSNRGHDTIAVFSVGKDGSIAPIGHVPTGGGNPRNFAVIGDGRFLLAANQDGENVVVYEIGRDGIPSATGARISVPKPVCLLPI